jgi:peptidoglycan/LPS O-acetylase OafA/YrhL
MAGVSVLGVVARKQTFYSIQIMRGIAAISVVIFHVLFSFDTPRPEFAVRNFAAGVDIFFVISGVVMYLTGRSLSASDFLRRRLIRIIPLYWLFLTLKLATLLVANVSARKLSLSADYVIKSYLFIPVYDGDGRALPLIVSGWTLSFEMYFYIICSLALLISPRRFLPIVAGVVATGVAVGLPFFIATPQHPPAAVLILAPIALEFVGGMLVASSYRRGVRLPMWLSIALIVAALGWLLVAPPQDAYTITRMPCWGIAAIAIVWGALNLEERFRFDRARFMLLLGDASYSIYLAHTAILPIAYGVLRRMGHLPVSIVLMLVFVIATTGGILIHLLIEKPLVRGVAALFHARPPKLAGKQM